MLSTEPRSAPSLSAAAAALAGLPTREGDSPVTSRPPVALIATPSGLHVLPWRPLTPEECVVLAGKLVEHAERHRPVEIPANSCAS